MKLSKLKELEKRVERLEKDSVVEIDFTKTFSFIGKIFITFLTVIILLPIALVFKIPVMFVRAFKSQFLSKEEQEKYNIGDKYNELEYLTSGL